MPDTACAVASETVTEPIVSPVGAVSTIGVSGVTPVAPLATETFAGAALATGCGVYSSPAPSLNAPAFTRPKLPAAITAAPATPSATGAFHLVVAFTVLILARFHPEYAD